MSWISCRPNTSSRWKDINTNTHTHTHTHTHTLSLLLNVGDLIRSMKFLSLEVALYLYKSTIRPCMEYCYHIWIGASSCYLEANIQDCCSFTCCFSWTLGSSSKCGKLKAAIVSIVCFVSAARPNLELKNKEKWNFKNFWHVVIRGVHFFHATYCNCSFSC